MTTATATLPDATSSAMPDMQRLECARLLVGASHAGELCDLFKLEIMLENFGQGYRLLIQAAHEIEALKQQITRTHGPVVIEALRASEPPPIPVPQAAGPVPTASSDLLGYDCEVTAHPLGGYTLRFADNTLNGHYGTRADAARFANLNFFRLKPEAEAETD